MQPGRSLFGTAVMTVLAVAGCQRQEAPASTVRSLETPAIQGSGESHLAVGPEGEIVMSWLEPAGQGQALRYSTLADKAWSAPRTVATGDNWFVNWADFPSVVPVAEGLWAAHWLVRQPAGGYAYDVAMALSIDGGESWGAPFLPHRDGTPSEHGFATLFPWRDGAGVVWLDGRNMIGEAAAEDAAHAGGSGGMSLRAAAVHADGSITDESVIDELTCDCCQTDVAYGAGGPIVVYRDRTGDEIRDIYAARAVEGHWTEPVPVADDGWRIDGCPVNGPAVDARGPEVVVAWFTAAADQSRVNCPGRTMAERLSWRRSRSTPRRRLAALAWRFCRMATRPSAGSRSSETGGDVALRRVKPSGERGTVRIVGQTTASRLAGFPQLVVSQERSCCRGPTSKAKRRASGRPGFRRAISSPQPAPDMARPRHLATSRPGGSLPSLILAVLSSAPPARQADPFERTIRVRDEAATPKSHRATGASRLVTLATEDSLR